MKLKKSNILLIVIAIFLLISIGSVCASENITDNSDVPLADDGANVVLSNNSDTDGNVPDEKINTTTETDEDTYQFDYEADKNISVKVKDNNKTKYIDVTKDNLKILEGNKTINFEYNNSIVTIKDALSVGNHSLAINYLGDASYANSTKLITLQIIGNNTIETETTAAGNGKEIEIPVKVHNGVNYIELNENNFNLTLVYTNENGNISNLTIKSFKVENGKIKFNSEDNNIPLIVGNLIINYENATEPKTVALKVSTEVQTNVTKDQFRSEEIKNISITILDGQGNLLNVTKNDLKVFDNGNELTNFKYENKNITLELNPGVHNVTIVYKGNSTYNTSNATVNEIKVYGNYTIDVPGSVESDGKTIELPIKLTDGVDNHNDELNSTNTEILLKYANETIKVTEIDWAAIAAGNLTVTLGDKLPTTLIVNYTDGDKKSLKNVAIKYITEIKFNPETVNITEGENATFAIQVIGADRNPINITVNDLTISKTGGVGKYNQTTGNVTVTGLKKGVYHITITYKGNDVNLSSKNYITINVRGGLDINTNVNATNVNSTLKGNEIKIINITNGVDSIPFTKEDLNITVSYKDGNDTKSIPIEWDLVNGTIEFTLGNGNFTTATLNINYKNGTSSRNVTLNRIYNFNIIPVTVEVDYQDGNFTFKLIDVDTGKALANKTVRVSGKNSAGTQVTWTIVNGNSYNIGITSRDLTSDENGTVTLEATFYPGYIIGNAFSPADTYNMTITGINGLNGTNLTILKVNKIDLNITVEKFDEYYGTDKKFTITVTNAKTGKPVQSATVNFKITKDGAEISYTNSNQEKVTSLTTNSEGKVELPASNLMTGNYEISANVTNSSNYNASSANGTATIKKIPVVINGKDVTIYYNSGTTYTIKVTKDGKAVSGVYLFVRLYTTSSKYNDYLMQTNSKGQVSFSASLDVGKHKIIVTSADNRYDAKQITKTITVKKASAKITAKKVTTYYNSGNPLVIKLTNTKNKKAIYNAKVKIQISNSKSKYKPITGITGMDGKTRLNLDGLAPGKYKVVLTGADSKNFEAKKVTTTIVIKKAPAKLTPKKLTAKKGAKKYFKVKVKNKKNKKVIKGVKVKIKVYTGKKAKTYTAKTNAKGIAKISTKKLKVGKHKVIVTSANKYVVAKKAKSTIKIKK